MNFRLPALLSLALAALPALASEQETSNAHYQATYVWQGKGPMNAPYGAANSLSGQRETAYTLTMSAAWGWRPWSGGELYFNPEAAQGGAFANLTGLGGFTNGEAARSSGPTLKLYRARLFLRQTWGFGGGEEEVASEANQLAGSVDKRRLTVTLGNLAVGDLFDDNSYSHDPRTQFLNWSLMTHGAWDYAADARGYTSGIAIEYFHDDWALRWGRFALPQEPNGMPLDPGLGGHHGDQLEVEHSHQWRGQPGKFRLLAYRNVAPMARYRDALALGAATASVPDLNQVRMGDQAKIGVGLNLEQALGDDLGVFARAMVADGRSEVYAFTEIDRSLSFGILMKGTAWHRNDDNIGLAFARNALSAAHRDYLAAGGLGFFIGDGRLNYRPETIIESFYSLGLGHGQSLSLDGQYIRNPAYNADRGPVSVISLRWHGEL